MENFDYSLMAHIGERGKRSLGLCIPIGKYGLPDEDSVRKVSRIIEEKECVRKPYWPFKRGRKLKEYWEQTEKIIYVDQKGSNYLSFRGEVFVVREEVKEEIERVFGEETGEYLEFLDLKLIDLKTKEEIIDIGKWYIMNILQVIEGTGEKEFENNGNWYHPILYRNTVLDETGKTKYPVYRMTERKTSPIISKEFKEVIDKFDNIEDAEVYFYRGLYYKEDLVGNESE